MINIVKITSFINLKVIVKKINASCSKQKAFMYLNLSYSKCKINTTYQESQYYDREK